MKSPTKITRVERGTVLLEYTLGVTLLVGMFIGSGIALQKSFEQHRNHAMDSAQTTFPCGPPLEGKMCL
jgi:hypothetical protein